MNPLIIYHANCLDGFTAAYVAWLKFGDAAQYVPMHYGSDDEQAIKLEALDVPDRDIYILDFSFSPTIIDALSHVAYSVTLLDHHLSAMKAWDDPLTGEISDRKNVNIQFDMTRSGAQLTWDYFYPLVPRPSLVNYVADRDLWRFDLHGTRAYCEALNAHEMTFKSWDIIAHNQAHILIEEGNTLLRAKDKRVQNATGKELRPVVLMNGSIPYYGLGLNAVNDISEIGNEIAKKYNTFSLSFFIKDDEAICSLRSIAPFDVSVIARNYGGGGHAQAAGFKLPIETFFKEIWSAK